MKVSLSWLRAYVDIDVPVEMLCQKLVMSGFEVESVIDLSASMDNVVAGVITAIEKHPDADKLQICHITADEELQIVTAATNVFVGAHVPVAKHRSLLPTGRRIEKGKLRGVLSQGMLCSGEELCLKEHDDGIMILDDSVQPGTDMRDVLRLRDIILDISVMANRPDCQSVLGIAREVAVALNKRFHLPEIAFKETPAPLSVNVSVEDADLCPRYMGREVKNLRIAPSPDWLCDRLTAAGMRPINNIVDITNYVLLETGFPLHAFDRREIAGGTITVRRAQPGESIVTLDEKMHELTPDMLVIADGEKPSCLAGIMGSAGSGIKDDTADLFLECAKFRRDSIRRTARALGMRTEASAHFEKGVDINGVEYAMQRALTLIDELDAGDVVSGMAEIHGELPQPYALDVPAQRVRDLLGVDVPDETMADILNRLDVPTVLENGTLRCRVPSRRDDIESAVDIAEEVMRVYGYEHIESAPMQGAVLRGSKLPDRIKTDKIKSLLVAAGLFECSTYSFISPKAADTLNLSADDPLRDAARLRNPLSEDYALMRTQLLTSMLTVLALNSSRGADAARLFEVGRRFNSKFEEAPVLCIGLYGEGEDFFTLKGLVGRVLAAFDLPCELVVSAAPYLHPYRRAEVPGVAVFGEVHPELAARYGLERRAYLAQIELAPLFAAVQKPLRYKPLPRFPAVERDVAFTCDESLPAAALRAAIAKAGGTHLESVELFDIYQGKQIARGQKSMAYRLRFVNPEATLTEADIEPAMAAVLTALRDMGCALRG
ncbi:MAG: phenylalanine--tRNA ligase subunit beta [Oscillospiraceae bacterium]|nr:phenylalanine--tRNA ligase subunit beta [Oscillospiraceae bacterium]